MVHSHTAALIPWDNAVEVTIARAERTLLRNLRQGIVFDSRNVRLLGIVSICCFIACAVCLVGCARIFFLGFVALAAGFVGLIVRIVKNVFSAAIDMRSELDLTV